jgi:hypothetical protein
LDLSSAAFRSTFAACAVICLRCSVCAEDENGADCLCSARSCSCSMTSWASCDFLGLSAPPRRRVRRRRRSRQPTCDRRVSTVTSRSGFPLHVAAIAALISTCLRTRTRVWRLGGPDQ